MVGPAASARLYYVHADHLERVQKITDASQTIVWDGQFTPYGRTHAITGTLQNPLRFPGQWADPAASYFYNYMRDYDPTLARYLSADPIGTAGGRNKFGYAGANPQNLVDPRGENPAALIYAGCAALFALSDLLDQLSEYREAATPCTSFAYDVWRGVGAALRGVSFCIGLPQMLATRPWLALAAAGARGLGRGRGVNTPTTGPSRAPNAPNMSQGPSAGKPGRDLEATAQNVEKFLGPGYTSMRTNKGNLQFVSADGTRIVRFDLQGYSQPHINVVVQAPGRTPGRFRQVINQHIYLK